VSIPLSQLFQLKAMGDVGVVFNPNRHEHKLHYTEELPSYKCSGCKGWGVNIGYKCPSCPEFVLHKICGASDDEIVHRYFPQDPLKFRTTTRLRHDCDACGVLIRGFLFQSRTGLRLHPLCLDLPPQLRHSGHPNHDHLRLNTNQERGRYSCRQCKKEHKRWKYACTTVPCEVVLDMNCAIIDMHDLSQHGISQVYKPSKAKHALKEVVKVGKAIGTTVAAAAFTTAVGEAGNAFSDRGRVGHDGGEDDEGGGHNGR